MPTASVEKLFGKPLDALKPGEAGPTVQGDVAFVGSDLPATNVVAVLEGSDPALRGEYVALGAHNGGDRLRDPFGRRRVVRQLLCRRVQCAA